MERVIILKNTVSGQELTLPVTPATYPMGAGREIERIDMAQTGQLALPGLKSLFSERLSIMLPARLYPFCTAGTVADPQYYIELLKKWSENGDVCRYIVAGGGVNAAVLLGPLEYEEKDGTNDVYVTIPLYEYRYLDEVIVETTQNTSRPIEGNNQSAAAATYTVVKGDTLSAICREWYGDAALWPRLAAYNELENPHLIHPGQVLQMPTLEELMALNIEPQPEPQDPPPILEAKVEIRGQLGLTSNAKFLATQVRR